MKRTREEFNEEHGVDPKTQAVEDEILRKSKELFQNNDVGSTLLFVAGKEIEVLWTITDDGDNENDVTITIGSSVQDDSVNKEGEATSAVNSSTDTTTNAKEEAKEVWWPCTVIGKSNEFHTFKEDEYGNETNKEIKLPIYEVLYSPLEPYASKSERAKLVVTGEHSLYDIGTNEILCYRDKGSNWEPEEEEEEEEVDEEEVEDTGDDAQAQNGDVEGTRNLKPLSEEESKTQASEIISPIFDKLTQKYQLKINELSSSHQQGIVDHMTFIREKAVAKVAEILQKKGIFSDVDAKETITSIVSEIQQLRE